MYATVRRYEGVKLPAETARRTKEEFVPMLQKIPGFVAFFSIDAGGGVLISTSVYESRESAEESNRKAADYVRKNFASALPNAPQITAGEVVGSSIPSLVHR
jgi:hypothetical protein